MANDTEKLAARVSSALDAAALDARNLADTLRGLSLEPPAPDALETLRTSARSLDVMAYTLLVSSALLTDGTGRRRKSPRTRNGTR